MNKQKPQRLKIISKNRLISKYKIILRFNCSELYSYMNVGTSLSCILNMNSGLWDKKFSIFGEETTVPHFLKIKIVISLSCEPFAFIFSWNPTR